MFSANFQLCLSCDCVDELTVTAWVVNGSRSLIEGPGRTAILACHSDSHGDIQLAWMKDGELLRQDEGQIRETGSGSELTLSGLTTTHAGEYVCVATRDHESVTSTPLSISITGLRLVVLPYSDTVA